MMPSDQLQSHEAQSEAKIFNHVNEIKENTPKSQLPQTISELEQYIKLRTLDETPYGDLPEELREEIGTNDPTAEFNDRVTEFDPWWDMTEQYGFTPESKTPKWSIDELKKLVEVLKR